MPRKPYVQFSGWSRLGAALSRLIDRYQTRKEWQKFGRSTSGLERGLWLERNDDDA